MWSSDGKIQIPKENDTARSLDLNTNGSIVTDMASRRGGSLMYDMTDMAHQKLDFSVLCQQTTSHIYTMGGFIEDSQPFIEKYDVQKGKWEIAGTFMNNRTKFSSLALPEYNSILIMGGKHEGARTAVCERYSLSDQLVMPSDITLTAPKSGFGALHVKDEIYVCGGNDGQSILKTFESFNLKTKRWTFLPPLELKRDELAVVVGPDHKIYAIGGFGGRNNTCLNEVERFDPQKGIWESVAPMNTPRRALAAVSLPDGIYAIGGFDGDNYLSSVEKYEESTNEWVFVSSMNYPRCTLSAVTSSDFRNIFVMGGFDNGPLKTVERYSVIDNTWEIIQPMHFKRFMHAAVIVHKS